MAPTQLTLGSRGPFNPHWRLQGDRFQQEIIRLSNHNPNPRPQVLSGETRFSPDKAYPEKFGAEAPEQPQNTARVKKSRIFPKCAGAGGWRKTGRRESNRRWAFGGLPHYRSGTSALLDLRKSFNIDLSLEK